MASFPKCTAAANKAMRESRMSLNPVQTTLIRVTREHREMLERLAEQNIKQVKDFTVRKDAMMQ